MSTANNIIDFEGFKRDSQQEMIDDIGARAFLFLRDEAEQANIPIKSVIVEHILGLCMVMGAVEGSDEAQRVLANIGEQLQLPAQA